MARRIGRLLAVVVASTAASMWSTSTLVGAASTLPASGLESLALHNAEQSGWVHEVTTASGQGHTFKMVNDIGTSEGRQVITSDGAHGQVLVIGGIAYLYGDQKAIAKYFGLSSTDPEQFANRWIEIPPANPDFATVSAAVTLASDFGGQVQMSGPLTEGPPRLLDGRRVVAITGYIPATPQSPAGHATLYVTRTGKTLPFEYRVTGKGAESVTRWSGWGRGVRLTTPASVPLGS